MKPNPWLPLCLIYASSSWAFDEVRMGLDPTAGSIRARTPVIIYLGGDVLPPTGDQQLNVDVDYLTQGLKGGARYGLMNSFSEEDQASFRRLSPEEQAFLREVAARPSHDISAWRSAEHLAVLEAGLLRPNPKYRCGLVVMRNFSQHGHDGTRRFGFNWTHRGPDRDDRSMIVESTDFSSLGKSAFAYPYSEQPVAHAGALRLLLKKTAELFPPEKHRYLVIVHGNTYENRVLSPHFPAAYTGVPIQKIREAILKDKASFLGADGKVRTDRGFPVALDKAVRSASPDLKSEYGIDPAEFLNLLGSIEGAVYPLVVLDTNRLDFSMIDPRSGSHIGTILYSSDPAPPYDALDLSSLFRYVGVKEKDIEDRLLRILRP